MSCARARASFSEQLSDGVFLVKINVINVIKKNNIVFFLVVYGAQGGNLFSQFGAHMRLVLTVANTGQYWQLSVNH